MNGAIGHRGRQVAASMFPALDAGDRAFCVPSVRGRRVAMPAALALLSLTTTEMAIAASAQSPWLLLPQPADVRLAPSGPVEIADGALVAVHGVDRQRLQPTADQFMELVANTR